MNWTDITQLQASMQHQVIVHVSIGLFVILEQKSVTD
jgi:hypothetical protein